MIERRIAFHFHPTEAHEAQGVRIDRSVGGERLAILDPVILLDHATMAEGASDTIGFPRHPHRGIETLSYVIAGNVAHKDSLGNEGKVGPGGTQWMTAGNGIYHEEMVEPVNEQGEMLQLWFSLPAAEKRKPAAYYGAESIPVVTFEGGEMRVLAGDGNGTMGAFTGIAVNPLVAVVRLEANASYEIAAAPGRTAFAYLFRGSLRDGELALSHRNMIVYTDGDVVRLHAGPNGAEVLVVTAAPLNEPILQYRSFVMNTPEDIEETLAMMRDGTFGRPA